MSSTDETAGPPADFVAQMYWAVVEGARLFEYLLGATEPDGQGGWVTYGPWDAAECSRQLLTWFDAGLIELFAEPGDDVPRPRNAEEWRAWNDGKFLRWLESTEARRLLAEPHRWTFESDDGLICVTCTAAGMDPAAPWW